MKTKSVAAFALILTTGHYALVFADPTGKQDKHDAHDATLDFNAKEDASLAPGETSDFFVPLHNQNRYESESNDSSSLADASYNGDNHYGDLPSGDSSDWWKFTLANQASINVYLGNIPSGSDYDLYLYSSEDTYNSIWRGVRSSNADELGLGLDLQPGTYFLRVQKYSGSSYSDYLMRWRIVSFLVTNYTLVKESDLPSTPMCNVSGLDSGKCYSTDFLCSGYGVAMQGTGYSSYGEYVKYVNCPNCYWNSNYTFLVGCENNATFQYIDAVRGASGRVLEPHYSIAVDPSVISLGSYVWLDQWCQWFRADDTGGAIDGEHIDIYTGTDNPGYYDYSNTYITTSPRDPHDPSPYVGGACWPGGPIP